MSDFRLTVPVSEEIIACCDQFAELQACDGMRRRLATDNKYNSLIPEKWAVRGDSVDGMLVPNGVPHSA